jgi:hypothetical protein
LSGRNAVTGRPGSHRLLPPRTTGSAKKMTLRELMSNLQLGIQVRVAVTRNPMNIEQGLNPWVPLFNLLREQHGTANERRFL